jgi:hypothetical protein
MGGDVAAFLPFTLYRMGGQIPQWVSAFTLVGSLNLVDYGGRT